MNLLVDSVTCNPHVGSNAEAGFGFASQALRRHNVVLLSHRDLFLQGGNPLAFDQSGHLRLELLRPSILGKLGRQTDYILRCYFHAKRIVDHGAIDIIHTVTPQQYRMTRPLAHIRTVPFVLGPLNGGDAYPPGEFLEDLGSRPIPQGEDAIRRRGLGGLADRFNQALVHGGIAQASTNAAFARAARIAIGADNCLNNIPGEHHAKCMRVPCLGIDTSTFTPREGGPNESPVILYAGRISAWKGLDLLLQAFASASRSRPAVLKVAGSGQGDPADERFERYCRDFARNLGIADRVDFCGHVPRTKLVEMYQECDVFCLTSLWEPFGLVYLEAMACGKPVVAMASGGPAEIVKPEFGFAVEPRRLRQFIDDLSQVIAELVDDGARRAHMGENARRHVLEHYTWDAVGEKMQAVYESAV
ncbi:MAG: glycosyltransferase [Chitinivibrionales bacterium]|nr:glycosyltransferase [Chitinivibrionales bacterium]MBD3394876.1 glycosyltransferase [Chitinivibrionales bacterium]